jgi:U2-associated protein SR140
LAAFFDNDEDESSFPVRRIEILLPFLRAHYSFLQ